MKRGVSIVLIAFAAGVGVGIAVDAFSCGRAESQRVSKEDVNISSGPLMVKGTRRGRLAHVDALVPSASANAHDSASDAVETTASTEDAASTAVVEVMMDNSPAPSPEISAEHAARQARRAAARAAQEEKRWDFLSTLNLDLLTDSQRKTHEMFLEAQKARDEAAAEIRRLRAAGEEVPADLQSRLADAQSVLRADHEAAGAVVAAAEVRADFGSFLKKATAAVSTAAEVVNSPSAAATSAASEATPAAASPVAAVPRGAAVGSAALPWAMDPKGSDYEFREKVKEYVKTLGVAKNEDVMALDKQLRDRAAADRAIVKSGGAGKAKAEEELDRYETFLSALDDELMRMGFDGSVAQNGDVGFKSYQLRTKNASTRVMWDPQAQKYFFYELYSLDKMFLNEADVNEAKFTANQLYYASVFADKVDTNTGRKLRYGGRICASRILAALQNNSTGNVTKQPMPKKGKLHDEFAAEALVIARGTLSHPDAEEVVIDADDWQIDYKFGNPVRRRFGYWVIKKADAGRKAFRMQAEQPYQGGGNYGKLRYHGVGGGQFYVE